VAEEAEAAVEEQVEALNLQTMDSKLRKISPGA
jgi:hypothetical protein